MVKVRVKVDPEVKVRSYPLRSWTEPRGQVAYQSIWELSTITMVLFSTPSQFDQKLLTKNAGKPKGPLNTSSGTSHKVKMQKVRQGNIIVVYDNDI